MWPLPPSFQPQVVLPRAHHMPHIPSTRWQAPRHSVQTPALSSDTILQLQPYVDLSDNFIPEASHTYDHDWFVRIAGWLSSCFLAVVLQILWQKTAQSAWPVTQHLSDIDSNEFWRSMLLAQLSLSFWVTAAASLGSDILLHSAKTNNDNGGMQRRFRCGNFGVMVADACGQTLEMVKVGKALLRSVDTLLQLNMTACSATKRHCVVCVVGLIPTRHAWGSVCMIYGCLRLAPYGARPQTLSLIKSDLINPDQFSSVPFMVGKMSHSAVCMACRFCMRCAVYAWCGAPSLLGLWLSQGHAKILCKHLVPGMLAWSTKRRHITKGRPMTPVLNKYMSSCVV